jgi:8-oxo-dGTP diphosphatase
VNERGPFIKVAVAVITDSQQRILITQRSMDVSYGGFWEFPGGKLENGESAPDALVREIKEEVGLEVLAHDYLGEVNYTYNNRAISLLIYHIDSYRGIATCREGQMNMQWTQMQHLKNFQFPPANVEIIELISQKIRVPVTVHG